MLTPRNFISVTIAIAVFSILSLCWSMLQPPDSGGLRADSYGTRGKGYRALFETFDELNVPVRRLLGPPRPEDFPESLLVLWNPRIDLINADPKWLRQVEVWLRNGGEAVLAFDDETPITMMSALSGIDDPDSDDFESDDPLLTPSLYELLGMRDLDIVRVDETEVQESDSGDVQKAMREPEHPFSDKELGELIKDVLTVSDKEEETRLYPLEAFGDFADSIPSGSEIELPVDLLYSIDVQNMNLENTLYVVTEAGNRHCVAARIPVGKGNVTVVSIRRLISNANLGSADNIVVASELFLSSGRHIVFDEFYHGATIRGNPFYLLSQRTYGSIAAMVCLVLGIAVWRAGVFLGPPVAKTPVQRRSIKEYIDAMSRFLREGKGHGNWSLQQVRDGVLWKLRREYSLPPESHDLVRLTTVMTRKDPERAKQLTDVLNDVNTVLTMRGSAGEQRIGQLIQRMTECLSKTDTTRSGTRSRK